MERKYLEPKEVEKIYRIKVGTLANWRSQGKGPVYSKCGRKVLYSVVKLDEWYKINQVRTIDQARLSCG